MKALILIFLTLLISPIVAQQNNLFIGIRGISNNTIKDIYTDTSITNETNLTGKKINYSLFVGLSQKLKNNLDIRLTYVYSKYDSQLNYFKNVPANNMTKTETQLNQQQTLWFDIYKNKSFSIFNFNYGISTNYTYINPSQTNTEQKYYQNGIIAGKTISKTTISASNSIALGFMFGAYIKIYKQISLGTEIKTTIDYSFSKSKDITTSQNYDPNNNLLSSTTNNTSKNSNSIETNIFKPYISIRYIFLSKKKYNENVINEEYKSE
jgi:hypothetical protein